MTMNASLPLKGIGRGQDGLDMERQMFYDILLRCLVITQETMGQDKWRIQDTLLRLIVII